MNYVVIRKYSDTLYNSFKGTCFDGAELLQLVYYLIVLAKFDELFF